MNNNKYDVIGVGFGPSNIAVACAMEEFNFEHNAIFLEAKERALWHENMLLEGSDIQNHPLRDLVTPRNPRSKYSFTNFLFEKNRLLEHLNMGMLFPFREEYAQYISWVASHFEDKVNYNTRIQKIELIYHEDQELYKVTDTLGKAYFSKSIIIAPGRTPNIPAEFKSLKSRRIIFLSNFLNGMQSFQVDELKKIAVIGGSQSAVEILLYLSNNYPNCQIKGITRRFGYLQKDVNPFTGEVYFPEFIDLFYQSHQKDKERLIRDLHLTNYSASDYDVLDKLYKKIYLQKIRGNNQLEIHRSADIKKVSVDTNTVTIKLKKIESSELVSESFDLVILATGFKNTGIGDNVEKIHPLLFDIQNYMELDQNGCAIIDYDYSVKLKKQEGASLFLNGLCESSHGMGDAGSFSLLALRSMRILESLNKTLNSKKDVSVSVF